MKINGRFIGIGHLPHQKISRLPQVGDVPLIIQPRLFKIFWELLAYRPTLHASPLRRMNLMAHRLLALKRLRGMSKGLAFFKSPPREVDHNSQTVQSCVSHERTRRLHHQFQEIALSWVQ